MSNDDSGSLLRRTIELLKSSEQSYLDIYDATGLNPNWLTGVATGRIADPSVNRVQKLYEHLQRKPLSV